VGLKENVILGHLIPAGTGFKRHLDLRVKLVGEPLPVEEVVPAFNGELEAANAFASSAGEGVGMTVVEEPGLPSNDPLAALMLGRSEPSSTSPFGSETEQTGSTG
jgi:hypothetical protein